MHPKSPARKARTRGNGAVPGPGANAPKLADLQAALTRAIIDGDDGILPHLRDNSRTDRATLLGVYRHSYIARLTDIIGEQYPTLARYVGDDAFAEMAQAYLRLHPSSVANVRWVGHALPGFLEVTAPFSDLPVLGELAKIERAIADAFDSADASIVGFSELSQVQQEDWGRLCFTPHPSVQRLDLATNAHQIWRLLTDGHSPPDPAALTHVDNLMIWRAEFQVQIRMLDSNAAQLWDSAAAGQTFGDICALAARLGDADKAAMLAATQLHGWVSAGQLSTVNLR